MSVIYLDNAATTKISDRVFEKMLPYLKEEYGNPGAIYSIGRRAKSATTKARECVADLIGASEDQIIFTSGGTESNNMVFSGLVEYLKKISRNTVIVSAIEHDSVIRAATSCIKHGFYIHNIGVDGSGKIDIGSLDDMLAGNVGLVSVMYVNNEIGTINNVKKIAEVCHDHGVLFHTDCVQAAPFLKIDVSDIDCDFLSISSHKIHGPKGVGAIYAKTRKLLRPIIFGGSEQEFGMRGGTENVPGIVGFGEACRLQKEYADRRETYGYNLKIRFYQDLCKEIAKNGLIPSDIIKVNGGDLYDTPGGILNIMFCGIDSETLVLLADKCGISISAGSACRSLEQKPSRVLKAIGMSDEDAMQSVRFSFPNNGRNEVDYDNVDKAASELAGLLKHMIV